MKKHIFLDNKKRKLFFNYEASAAILNYIKTAQHVGVQLNKKIMLQAQYRFQKLKLYRYSSRNLCIVSGRQRSTYLNTVSRHKFLEYQSQGLLFGWKKL